MEKEFDHSKLGIKYKGKEHWQQKQIENNSNNTTSCIDNSINRHAGESESRQNSI